jgi:hypothetical protein
MAEEGSHMSFAKNKADNRPHNLRGGRKTKDRETCADWVQKRLAVDKVPAEEFRQEALEQGFGWRVLDPVLKELQVYRAQASGDNRWWYVRAQQVATGITPPPTQTEYEAQKAQAARQKIVDELIIIADGYYNDVLATKPGQQPTATARQCIEEMMGAIAEDAGEESLVDPEATSSIEPSHWGLSDEWGRTILEIEKTRGVTAAKAKLALKQAPQPSASDSQFEAF